MHIIKAFCIAFSMYSKIPMPQFEWKERDMKYMLCFFPWVGAVIGGLVWLWGKLCGAYGIGSFCYTLIGGAIPLLVTGGIHVDGFVDTMDAFHSYQPRERKLEILKDAHIGAFAVIMLAAYGLVYLGAFSEVGQEQLGILCAGFFLARCLSGIGVVSFPSAKREGLVWLFAGNAHKRIVRAALYVQGAACIVFMLFLSSAGGAAVAGAALCAFAYYYFRCKKEIGGITGDTAGYFVLLCEGGMAVAAAAVSIFG